MQGLPITEILTICIRLCQTSMNSGEEVLTRLAFCVQAGQVHSGIASKAMVGERNVNVPPWRMGNLALGKKRTLSPKI